MQVLTMPKILLFGLMAKRQVQIVVQAENGVKKTYTIQVTRGAAQQESQDTQQKGETQAPADGQQYFTIDGTNLYLTDSIPDRYVLNGFVKDTVTLWENQYPCMRKDGIDTPLRLLYLVDENGQNGALYILAGKKKLEQVRQTELVQLTEKAKASGLPEDAQAARDLSDLCDRFEKKLYDLQLTRTISIQMGPQIRLIQNNDTMMAEKIQTTLVNTIPLWKNQMVLSLGMAHSQQAMEAQRAVTDMTNDLLKHNAEALKQGTIDTARESERGLVDLETLQQTNKSLIDTLDELAKIQSEGKRKRAEAEVELGRIEGELKNKLLQMNPQ